MPRLDTYALAIQLGAVLCLPLPQSGTIQRRTSIGAAYPDKLPQITLLFWIMKICATTLGETAGDLLSMTLGIGYAASSLALVGIFLATLITQVWSTKFRPALYWTVILSTSTAGTTMSDYIDRTLGLGYVAGSALLIFALAAVLIVWRLSEHSLSVTHVATRRAELFYWSTILVSNTLGTAFGDFLADSSGMGFAGGALLISGALTLTVVARYLTDISPVLLFWVAFVLTRPLGATVGDLLTKTHDQGGLGFGTIGASAVLFATLSGLILLTCSAKNTTAA